MRELLAGLAKKHARRPCKAATVQFSLGATSLEVSAPVGEKRCSLRLLRKPGSKVLFGAATQPRAGLPKPFPVDTTGNPTENR